MKIPTIALSIATHLSAIIFGFALGIYAFPILLAPPSPSDNEIEAISINAEHTGQFTKNLKDSDFLHWGEGQVSIGKNYIALKGELAPGPDYKLYLSPKFVETEEHFERLKPQMALVGDIKTFDNFIVELAPNVNTAQYTTVVIWCETFGQFISSAKYRELE